MMEKFFILSELSRICSKKQLLHGQTGRNFDKYQEKLLNDYFDYLQILQTYVEHISQNAYFSIGFDLLKN